MVTASGAGAVDGPPYAVVKNYEPFEVRQYAPYLVAEVTVAEVTVPGPVDEVWLSRGSRT